MNRFAISALLAAFSLTSFAATPTTTAPANTTNTNNTSPASLNPQVFQLAKSAYECAVLTGAAKPQTLTIIDYSLPSTQKRMWVINMQTNQVLYNTLVAHGQGSGGVMATRFSNQAQSHATSLGLFKTASTYEGKNGYSLRLIGLDQGFNSNAMARAVVMHGAPYVNDNIAKSGRLGRSWGCPAVPKQLAQPIINTIKDGNLVFAYYPDQQWLKNSKYLNCAANFASLTSQNKSA